MGTQKANVLRAYRELVALARGMPATERDAKLQEARAAIRANAGEPDPGKASDQLKLLWARLSWLQVTTQRRPGDRRRGSGTFVVRNGEVVEGEGQEAGTRVASSKLDMPEAKAYHAKLLKRQYFGRMPSRLEPF